ncbi:MAG TPA: metalloregulator ArsR/SmtB family transcription factor [Terracidiphilus sp.]|nr:metalloregulator ArsR/SmtB family transcription factor [Terracidiphilus sp.]
MYQIRPMPSIVKMLRAAADPTRLRILLLLKAEELTVAELQEILTMGQSTISTHLAQLKQAGLVEDRRAGKSSLYRLAQGAADDSESRQGTNPVVPKDARNIVGALAPAPHNLFLNELLAQAAKETPEAAPDQAAMRRAVRKRQERMRSFFDSMAGRLGKDYVPGKSWKSIAEALLRLMPPMTIADLGAGDGSFSLLLAAQARRVIAVDSSEKMLEVGRDQAARHGATNIEFRQGDMEETPIDSSSIDLVFFSQSLHHALHPDRAISEAARILVPGGRVVILDLARHRFEEARELYADQWLGFGEAELEEMLEKAGFENATVAIIDRDPEAPQFQTLLAIATKAP